MAKRKTQVKRKKSKTAKFTSLVAISVSCLLCYQVFDIIKTTFELKNEIKESKEIIDELMAEEEDLTSEKEKLQDPEYVKRLARGKYSWSKDGEQIFILPDSEE